VVDKAEHLVGELYGQIGKKVTLEEWCNTGNELARRAMGEQGSEGFYLGRIVG
jgi:hypothetical protein